MSPTSAEVAPIGYVLAATASAAAYGLTDFLGGYATRFCPTDVTVLVSQLAALPLVLLAAVAGAAVPTTDAVTWGTAAGLTAAFGLRLLYRALAIGPMAVVAPVAAILSALVPVAAGLAAGQQPSDAAALGGAAALVAIVLLSAAGPIGRPTANGLTMAAGAGLLFGLTNVLLGRAHAGMGLWPVVIMLAVICLVAGAGVARLPRPAVILPPLAVRALGLAAASGVAQAVAAVATLLAVRGNLITVGPVLALYPAGTVLLAVTVARERLSFPRACGLVTAGVAVVALARA